VSDARDDDDDDVPVPGSYRRGRPVLAAFVTSLITTVAAFVALNVADRRGLLEFLNGGQRDVEVPSINGVTAEQARDLLLPRELLLTLQGERPDPVVPTGKIAVQIPLAGSHAARGTAVQAFLSSGPAAVTIPTLTGARPDDAVEQLRNRKLLTARRQEDASETIAAGLVIATDPPAGQTLGPGAEVTLIVSTGPAPRRIPKVLGFSLGKAKKMIEDAGFKVGATRIGSSDRYDDDVIIKQDPPENTLAARGSDVTLVIND
jgi:serine/threonine-protein kinase